MQCLTRTSSRREDTSMQHCNACKYISLNPPRMSSDVLPAFSELALEGNVSIWCRCHSETCNSLRLYLNSLRCSFTQLHSKVCWTKKYYLGILVKVIMEYKTKNGVDMLLKKSSPRSDKNKQTKKYPISIRCSG